MSWPGFALKSWEDPCEGPLAKDKNSMTSNISVTPENYPSSPRCLPTHLPKENLTRLHHIHARQTELNSWNRASHIFSFFVKTFWLFLLHSWPWFTVRTIFCNPTLSIHSCVLIAQKKVSLNYSSLNTFTMLFYSIFFLILFQLTKLISRTLEDHNPQFENHWNIWIYNILHEWPWVPR